MGWEAAVRYGGVVLALVGVVMARPAATKHLGVRLLEALLTVPRYLRKWSQRLWQWLLHKVFRVEGPHHGAVVTLHAGVAISGSGEMRLFPEWKRHHTLRKRVRMLDIRTRDLDRRLGSLGESLKETEKRLSEELAETRNQLVGASEALEAKIGDLEKSSVTTDARALPIIALGVIMSGLSPDVRDRPVVIVVSGIVVAFATLVWLWRWPNQRSDS